MTTEQRLGDGTQTLPSPDGYLVPCRCGAMLTWLHETSSGPVANCPCGMSYYAIDETTVKIEGIDRSTL